MDIMVDGRGKTREVEGKRGEKGIFLTRSLFLEGRTGGDEIGGGGHGVERVQVLHRAAGPRLPYDPHRPRHRWCQLLRRRRRHLRPRPSHRRLARFAPGRRCLGPLPSPGTRFTSPIRLSRFDLRSSAV